MQRRHSLIVVLPIALGAFLLLFAVGRATRGHESAPAGAVPVKIGAQAEPARHPVALGPGPRTLALPLAAASPASPVTPPPSQSAAPRTNPAPAARAVPSAPTPAPRKAPATPPGPTFQDIR
jgi:hypothetical protein